MERQKFGNWKCGIVSSDLCAKENLMRTQCVVKRRMNFYTVVSKKVRMVIVNRELPLKHKGYKVDYASNN